MERNGYRDHSSQDSVSEKQDAVFDKYLDEMKPFVLRLCHKSGKPSRISKGSISFSQLNSL